jgi:hypothetical protein
MSGRTEGGAKGRRTIRLCDRTYFILATLRYRPGHCRRTGKRGTGRASQVILTWHGCSRAPRRLTLAFSRPIPPSGLLKGSEHTRSGPGRRCPPTARGSLRRHTCRRRPVAHPRSRPTSCGMDYRRGPESVSKTRRRKCGKGGSQRLPEASRRESIHVLGDPSTFVIHGRSRSASELRRPEDPCLSIAAGVSGAALTLVLHHHRATARSQAWILGSRSASLRLPVDDEARRAKPTNRQCRAHSVAVPAPARSRPRDLFEVASRLCPAGAATALPAIRAGPVCALSPHAGIVAPPGKPDGGTSPATRLRQPRDGGAGPFPPNRRRDRASRRKGPGQDKGGGEGVDKMREGKCKSQRIGEFHSPDRANLSTFARPPPLSSFSGKRSEAECDPGNHAGAAGPPALGAEARRRVCTAGAPSSLRHGFPTLSARGACPRACRRQDPGGRSRGRE